MRKRTHEDYIKELKLKNPNLEVVDTYIDAVTNITHHCLLHDIYWKISPVRALKGCGCELCRREKFNKTRTKTHAWYTEKVQKLSPQIRVLEEYKGMRIPISHKCLKHNIIWNATPDNILHGCGCKECGKERIRIKNRMSYDEYISRLASVNPDIICIKDYQYATHPALHKCLKDGFEWYALPSQILDGRGCPICRKSKGEKQIRQWLTAHDIEFCEQKCFDSCRDRRPLPFDFYIPKSNTVIEYDGEQHYRAVDFFGGEKEFALRQRRDRIKSTFCEENRINILRIPYYENVEIALNQCSFI